MDAFETTIKGSKDQTILDAALENDVDAPYSCQGGACATCIGRLVSGNAAMQRFLYSSAGSSGKNLPPAEKIIKGSKVK